MAIKTHQERLEEIDTAISKVLSAQSLGKGDMQLYRAQYKALCDERRRVLSEYQSETGAYYRRTYGKQAGRTTT